MNGISFEIDYSQISDTERRLALEMGQFEWISARAMTTAAKAAKSKLQTNILPRIEGGPTSWTRRGLIASFATKDNLTSNVGWNYGGGSFTETGEQSFKSGGVPSGRYMEVNARGGDRNPKSTELQLRRSRLIDNNQFITPAIDSDGVKLDRHGNVSRGEYTRMLSRVRALEVGSAPSGSGSRGRSGKARSKTDYFIARGDAMGISRWQLGTKPIYIARRSGHGPKGGTGKGSGRPGRPQTIGYRRGFDVSFHIISSPNYESRFPIKSIAMAEYRRVFNEAWRKGLENELNRRR